MDLPDWLTTLLGRWTPGAYPFRETQDFLDILEGDVVLVGAMEGSAPPHQMVVAFDVDEERRLFLGAPLTTDLSLATADSVILDPEHTDLPYKVAVLSGAAVHLWFVQADERLGALTEEAVDAVWAGYYGGEDRFQSSHRGVPLQEPRMDLRWTELDTESSYTRELARDCLTKRWDEDLHLPFVDPRLLPVPGNSHNGLHAEPLGILEDATREGRTRGFSPGCVEQVAATLDCRILRAYPTMFQPRGSIATSPPAPRDQDDPGDWFFEITKADALAGAGFVKVIGTDKPSGPTRFESNKRRYEFLYERI